MLLSAIGVHVFFVLSGYLITGLLQKEYGREGRIDLVAFYRRRCFRIFPAAFTYILVIALLSPASRSALVYAATYTISYHPYSIPLLFQHLWSLSVEEQFYLLWPLALLLGFRSSRPDRMACDASGCRLSTVARLQSLTILFYLSALLFSWNHG